MHQIHTNSSASKNDQKQISCLRSKTKAGILWGKLRKCNKTISIGAYKLVVKKAKYYL